MEHEASSGYQMDTVAVKLYVNAVTQAFTGSDMWKWIPRTKPTI